jgi:3-hydroxypropanoate dehydrogenase
MPNALNTDAQKIIFTEARSHHAWDSWPITDAELNAIYELMKWGPTSVNSAPGRFLMVRSEAAKARLYPALMESNIPQVKAASVSIVVAFDTQFFERLDKLWPAFDAKPYFTGDAKLAADTAFRNSSMQGAYLMIAARALGWDICALSGFDNAKVDEAFFAGTDWRSNFIINIGRGREEGLFPRGPRLDFAEASRIV